MDVLYLQYFQGLMEDFCIFRKKYSTLLTFETYYVIQVTISINLSMYTKVHVYNNPKKVQLF